MRGAGVVSPAVLATDPTHPNLSGATSTNLSIPPSPVSKGLHHIPRRWLLPPASLTPAAAVPILALRRKPLRQTRRWAKRVHTAAPLPQP